MSGIATFEIENNRLIWGQSTQVIATLQNTGEEDLSCLNSNNLESTPTFILKDLKTGNAEVFSKVPPPGLMASSDIVAVGEKWTRPFDLISMIDFPTSGMFEISARFDWSGGNAISEPVTIEVVPSLARAVSIETATGGPYGDVYCVWTNNEGSETGLWMWRIGATFETKIKESYKLGNVSASARPVLSVPPNSASQGKIVAWIEGSDLKYVNAEPGNNSTGTVSLDAPDYVIVRPLLESRFGSNARVQADVLLARSNGQNWELRLVNTGDVGDSRKVVFSGRLPDVLYNAYRSDESRRTVILQEVESELGPFVRLSCLKWQIGPLAIEPIALAECAGKLVAYDQALLEDDSLAIAAFFYQASEKRYQLLVWRLESSDDFRFSTSEWLEGRYSNIFLRVCPNGSYYLLLKNEDDGRWITFDSRRGFGSLPEDVRKMGDPAAVFFVNRDIPAIISIDSECGLRISFPENKPRRITLSAIAT